MIRVTTMPMLAEEDLIMTPAEAREIRRTLQIDLKTAALILGVGAEVISRYESGRTQISRQVANHLLTLVGKNPYWKKAG